jgi:hypothetical protein
MVSIIRQCALTSTHMFVILLSMILDYTQMHTSVPHYHVMSKRLDAGIASGVVNWVRAFLVESLFRPICEYSYQNARFTLLTRL